MLQVDAPSLFNNDGENAWRSEYFEGQVVDHIDYGPFTDLRNYVCAGLVETIARDALRPSGFVLCQGSECVPSWKPVLAGASL
ncbi:hypothetical protein L227DRAFT_151265 [Lentinus tigrinus ALCF2SS1-6]|uniref:Uncharacterized protein n=1 Tax=Lentinus tigrinus ALCF2SS1-6 TaxID=1328759 RepID=A0A5C2S6Q8_9APHY|nr:hypothetical protein L227DRAFT_151265 [Lentinus tigrinus ALCF2SS1-6]